MMYGSTLIQPGRGCDLSASQHSVSSTVTVDRQAKTIQIHGRSSHVRFQEDFNQHYESSYSNKLQSRKAWYDRKDYERFRRETLTLARVVVAIHQEPKNKESRSWLRDLGSVCEKLSEPYQSVYELREILSTKVEAIPDAHVGLERWTLRSLYEERRHQRHCLYYQIRHFQETLADPSEEISRISQVISRPSCLVAFYFGLAGTPDL
jgi:hypothetical protein